MFSGYYIYKIMVVIVQAGVSERCLQSREIALILLTENFANFLAQCLNVQVQPYGAVYTSSNKAKHSDAT